MATVKYSIYKNKMVYAIYSDIVTEALTEGVEAATIMAAMSEESDVEVPAIKELRALNTYCKAIRSELSEESGESGESGEKYLVRAVLRYIPVSDESESV